MNIRTDVPEASPVQPRPRGAPKGNCNARRHGCRSARIVEAQRKIIKEETDFGRLDREILLAIFQQVMINTYGATTRVAVRLALRLVRLVCLKYGVHSDDDAAFDRACERLKFDLPLTPELAAKLARVLKEPVASHET